jgi:hypothetical protein
MRQRSWLGNLRPTVYRVGNKPTQIRLSSRPASANVAVAIEAAVSALIFLVVSQQQSKILTYALSRRSLATAHIEFAAGANVWLNRPLGFLILHDNEFYAEAVQQRP